MPSQPQPSPSEIIGQRCHGSHFWPQNTRAQRNSTEVRRGKPWVGRLGNGHQGTICRTQWFPFHPPEMMVLFSGACWGQNKGNTSKLNHYLQSKFVTIIIQSVLAWTKTHETYIVEQKPFLNSLCSQQHPTNWYTSTVSTERATSLALTSQEPNIYSFENLDASCQCKAAGYFLQGHYCNGQMKKVEDHEHKKCKPQHVFNIFDAIPGVQLWPL